MSSSSKSLLALGFVGSLGCPPAFDTGIGDKEPFACTLGLVADDGAFVPFGDGAPVELVLGFQGFLYVEFVAEAADPPAVVDATMYADIADVGPIDGAQPAVAFVATADAHRTDALQLFLTSGSVGEYAGRSAHLVVRLEDATHACVASADVLLVDEDGS
jgi:hypothetical protein